VRAAETEADGLAPSEMIEAQSSEPDLSVEREAPAPGTLAEPPGGPSERDAEIDALREALAIVLGSESQADLAEAGSTAAAEVQKVETESAEPPEAEPPEPAPPTDAAEPDAPDSQTESDTPSRRKKGLFGRFGGR
ncbi:MAG: hypothetical protein ACXWN4_02205, partial [Candidatus Limnocylindrales bacterium]